MVIHDEFRISSYDMHELMNSGKEFVTKNAHDLPSLKHLPVSSCAWYNEKMVLSATWNKQPELKGHQLGLKNWPADSGALLTELRWVLC